MGGTFGYGGTFKLGTTTVSELTSIKPPSYEADDIEVTTHNSSDRFKEYIKGLIDAGEVEIEGNFSYTDYATVYSAMITSSLYSVTITLPTTPSRTQFLCNGFVTGLECEDPVDDKIEFSATLKISGKPALSQV
jgi:predicted secreted protein